MERLNRMKKRREASGGQMHTANDTGCMRFIHARTSMSLPPAGSKRLVIMCGYSLFQRLVWRNIMPAVEWCFGDRNEMREVAFVIEK